MLRALPEVIEPDTWILVFHRRSPYWWVRLLACGRYKHVSAFAWLAPLRAWLVYDVTLDGTRLVLLPESGNAIDRLTAMTADADLLVMPRRVRKSYPFLAPFYCVPVVKHLIGLRSGALLPIALWRDCLANGAKPIHGAAEPIPQRANPAGATAGAG